MEYLEKIRGAKFELVAFITGAAVMMLEVVGARLIAPYFGASTYVWTAMIGTILGALAIGYWFGGKIADRDHEPSLVLSFILAGAAALVLATSFFHEIVLNVLAFASLDLRVGALLAGLVLFVPPSLMIGMVGPHLAKIRVTSLKTTGQSIGRLEAWSALGSIAGTFLCGYWLLGFVGSRNITLLLVVMLILTSIVVERKLFLWARVTIAVVALLLIVAPKVEAAGVVADIDSAYARYRVVKSEREGRPVYSLLTDSYSVQSQAYIGHPEELPITYANRFLEVAKAYPDLQKITLIGGGTHTFPTALSLKKPGVDITIVEIDPALDELAKKYFAFKPSETLRVIHEDGRAYVNKHTAQTDILFVDAYTSLTPPFQLTTREAVAHMKDNIQENGAVIVNVIGSQGGSNDDFVNAIYATYASEFKHVALFQANPDFGLTIRQNLILVATDSELTAENVADQFEAEILPSDPTTKPLTDDLAPVERLSY